MWRQPLPCLAPLWSAQGRGWGGEEGGEGPRRRSTEDTGREGHRGAEKGQRRAGCGGRGEGRGHCSWSPSSLQAPGCGCRRALGSELPLGPSQRRSEGARLATPSDSPTCPGCRRGLGLTQSRSRPAPSLDLFHPDKTEAQRCRVGAKQGGILFPSQEKLSTAVSWEKGHDLPTGLGVKLKPFLELVMRPLQRGSAR